jgi:hypothetical protein
MYLISLASTLHGKFVYLPNSCGFVIYCDCVPRNGSYEDSSELLRLDTIMICFAALIKLKSLSHMDLYSVN